MIFEKLVLLSLCTLQEPIRNLLIRNAGLLIGSCKIMPDDGPMSSTLSQSDIGALYSILKQCTIQLCSSVRSNWAFSRSDYVTHFSLQLMDISLFGGKINAYNRLLYIGICLIIGESKFFVIFFHVVRRCRIREIWNQKSYNVLVSSSLGEWPTILNIGATIVARCKKEYIERFLKNEIQYISRYNLSVITIRNMYISRWKLSKQVQKRLLMFSDGSQHTFSTWFFKIKKSAKGIDIEKRK